MASYAILCKVHVQITKIHFYVCNDVIIFVSDEMYARMLKKPYHESKHFSKVLKNNGWLNLPAADA